MYSDPIINSILIDEFNPKFAAKELWEKYHVFDLKFFKDHYPRDNPKGKEVIEEDFKQGSVGYHSYYWLVFDNAVKKKVIAFCSLEVSKEDSSSHLSNKDKGYFYIKVDSEYQRKGIGTELLKIINTKAKEANRKTIETDTSHQSGKNFCSKFNSKIINHWTENRLLLDEVNCDMINQWVKECESNNPEIKLEGFSKYPDKVIQEMAELETILERDMPYLDEDSKWQEVYTTETLRQQESNNEKMKIISYKLIIKEKDGTISGMTEIRYSLTDRPERINQGLTGVLKQYRGKGLGKYLKAKMLLYIKENLPQAKFISTGNADHNVPMMTINSKLGFKPHRHEVSYKFLLEDLTKILNKS